MIYAACDARMRADGVDSRTCSLTRIVDARYASQSYDLQIEVPAGPITATTVAALVDRFHQEHERIYGHAQRNQRVRFVTLRAVLAHKLAQPRFAMERSGGSATAAKKGERLALFDINSGYQPTPVYDRPALPAGCTINGPAILEQPDTTTVLYPGQTLRVASSGHLLISRLASAASKEAA